MPRHGIGQQVQRSSAASIPHDRITILQISSSRSLPLDRPRQSASRHPPLVTNRPTTYRVRRDPRLIQQPFHHPPACWSASTPFTHLIRGTQIPIVRASLPTCPSRGFLPWRFADAGPRARRTTVMGRHPKTFTKAVLTASERDFWSTPNNGRQHVGQAGPFRAKRRHREWFAVATLGPSASRRG